MGKRTAAGTLETTLSPGNFTKELTIPLIESDALLQKFGGLLGSSTKVDIAVAWARSGPISV